MKNFISMLTLLTLLSACAADKYTADGKINCTNYQAHTISGAIFQAARDLPSCEEVKKNLPKYKEEYLKWKAANKS